MRLVIPPCCVRLSASFVPVWPTLTRLHRHLRARRPNAVSLIDSSYCRFVRVGSHAARFRSLGTEISAGELSTQHTCWQPITATQMGYQSHFCRYPRFSTQLLLGSVRVASKSHSVGRSLKRPRAMQAGRHAVVKWNCKGQEHRISTRTARWAGQRPAA